MLRKYGRRLNHPGANGGGVDGDRKIRLFLEVLESNSREIPVPEGDRRHDEMSKMRTSEDLSRSPVSFVPRIIP